MLLFWSLLLDNCLQRCKIMLIEPVLTEKSIGNGNVIRIQFWKTDIFQR